ncbi:DNA polymerase III subunit chi [Pseudothauera nasutitermitis]|uniref:DNA polymerase III subunit chi n=1 Tax=Pseudothauera nasutitermitis TaxID=2565930 RepID=A0A4S4APB4_9RHOO|nr:DNA polymerase III subunit chi [Pseudothauera nasutitermitis]THF61520.1 DNA polymerase III subunit chi [Pseudothauera nasutitermitis]
MPKVQFYHNAADRIGLACELAARAHAGGRRVALRLDDPAEARRLDHLLWSFEQLAFIPHVAADSPLAAETPVVIGRAQQRDWPHQDVLINLAADLAADFEQFRMVVEIVGQSEADKAPARERFRHYKQRELPIQAFDAVRREAL